MASLNKVFLIGNLTKDPDVRELPTNSTYVATTSLAVNSRMKDRNDVMFIDIVAYGRQAEVIGEYMKKGSSILVEGRLVFRQWETEGQKRSKHEVIVESFQFLNGRRDDSDSYGNDSSYGERSGYQRNNNPEYGNKVNSETTEGNTNSSSYDSNSITEDDVPF